MSSMRLRKPLKVMALKSMLSASKLGVGESNSTVSAFKCGGVSEGVPQCGRNSS